MHALHSVAELNGDHAMHHLIRRGAGAEDEALREALPAERRVRAARESCQKHNGEDDLLRHSTSGTHLRARDWDGIYRS